MDIVRADGARYSEKYKMPRSPLPSEQAQVHGVRRLGYRITANICAFGWKARDFALKGVDGNIRSPTCEPQMVRSAHYTPNLDYR